MITETIPFPNPVIPPDVSTSEIMKRIAEPAQPPPRDLWATARSLTNSRWFPLAGGLLGLGALAALVFPLLSSRRERTTWDRLTHW